MRNRAFTLLELLVVVGIITLLVGLLLPVLNRAREQARYVRWQAFSRDMSMDPNIVLHYNFQNDLGQTTITNMAVGNQNDRSLVPSKLDGRLLDHTAGFRQATAAQTQGFWASSGRFKGKPCANFSNNGVYIAVGPTGPETGKLANLLKRSQQVTIMVWEYVAGNNFVQHCSVFHWASDSTLTTRCLNAHLPWQGSVFWDAAFHSGGSGPSNRLTTAMSYGNDSPWTLWCFTKDAKVGSMKIYQNGVLVNYASGQTGLFSIFDLNPPTSADQGNLVIGYLPPSDGLIGSVDEIAIFDAALSVDPLTGAGSTTIGSVAPRFLDMYNMGIN